VLTQAWSRRLWAAAMKDKTWEVTNKALKQLLKDADLPPNEDAPQTADLLHDAGLEFSRVSQVLPEGFVERTKAPLDRQGIASLDKAIQTLKVNLEDIVERKGGSWVDHLQDAVNAYSRAYNSSVLGPPKTAEDNSTREFLIDQTNAQNMYKNHELVRKRIENVTAAKYFRESTGAKRAFHQQYGPKLQLESVEPGGSYVRGSDNQLHLLKRVIPVHQDSEEPQGKLVQPREFKRETLRDLAEDMHADMIGNPRDLKELSQLLDPLLLAKDAKIKTRAFVEKYPDLFRIDNGKVHALVLSAAKKQRVVSSTKTEPVRITGSFSGGSSSSKDTSGKKPGLTFFEALSYRYGDKPPSSAKK
jgi:hypothetical protein